MHLTEHLTRSGAGPADDGTAGAADDGLAGRVAALLAEVVPAHRTAPPGATLRDAGLGSLAAARLSVELQLAFGVEVPLARLGECTGAAQLAEWISLGGQSADSAVPPSGAAPSDVTPSAVAPSDAGEDDAGPFPVTPLQQAYLLGKHEGATDDPIGCHLYRELEVPDLDAPRLRDAWAAVLAEQEMLRTRIGADGRQEVLPEPPAERLPVHDRRDLDTHAFAAHVTAVRERLSHRVYAPGEWPLFTVEVSQGPGGRSVVHLSLDALLTDGTGLDLLLARWWEAYHEPGARRAAPETTVRECLAALRRAAVSPAGRADLAYWVRRLEHLPPGPDVLRDPPPAPTGTCRRRTPRAATLPAPEWAALKRRAGTLAVSPSALVLAVLADTLRARLGDAPFGLVLTTNDRVRLPSAADGLVGPFTSSAVTVVDAPAGAGLDELARGVHRRIWEDLDHGRVSGVEVLRELRRNRPVPPLPVVFTSLLDTAPLGDLRPGTGTFADHVTHAVSQTSDVALDVQVREDGDGLRVHWDCADDVLRDGLGELLFTAFVNALATVAAEPSAEAGDAAAGDAAARRPLNELQRAYFVARMTQDGPWDGCQVSASFPVRDLDLARLETAWARMVAAHDVLRTVVTRDGDLRILPSAPARWRIPVLRGADGTDPGRDGALQPDLVRRAFPLDRWPQFDVRVTAGDGPDATVHVTLDLVACDGRSVHRLLRELFRLYADPAARPVPASPSPAEPGAEGARAEGTGAEGAGAGDAGADAAGADAAGADAAGADAAGADDARRAEATRYWRDRLADLPPGPRLPMPGAPGGDPARIRHSGSVPGWRRLRARAEAAGLHPDALLTAALTGALATRFAEPFAVPLVRWTERTEPWRPGEHTALSWIEHDPRPDVWQRAAAYQRLIDGDTAADVVSGLAELRRTVLRRRRDDAYGYPVVRTGLLDLGDHRLPAGVELGPWLTCTPDVSMDCIDLDDGDDELRCFWDVVEADLAPGVPGELFATYLGILRSLSGEEGPGPAGRASPDLGRLTPEEFERIVHGWNDTAREFPAPGPVHVLFERQARLRPDAVAVRSARAGLTYRQLDRRANALAWRLRDLGVGVGDVVAVSVARGVEMATAVYGVLKAGAAYLPVDPHLPAERAHDMLADARAVAVVATPGSPAAWPVPDGVPRLELSADPDLGDPERAGRTPEPLAGLDDVAYVIYTSGSTGRPKGVVVTHRPLHNLFHWCGRTFGFGPDDTGLCVTSLGFDLSVFDLLCLPGYGAGLYVADEAEQRDPELLVEVLRREGITFWNSAPTTLHQLAPFFPEPGTPGRDALRLVFLSGDYTPLSLPPALWEAFPNARLVSLGGATEATVWSNWFPVDHVDPAWRSIPYGRPIDNSRYHVLDEQLRPLPPGEEGDLYIGGVCLSQGYLGRPELTAERFVRDPFSPDPAERLYRTGDRASYFPDGVICFLGRLDHQVKIRGFRIELGEIEHRLRRHPAVVDAVVLAHPDPTGDRKLVAYVIAAPGAAVTAAEVREYVAGALPEYMVPNHVAFLDRFPATANGKLDRDALPWPLDGVATVRSVDVVTSLGAVAPVADGDSARGSMAVTAAAPAAVPGLDAGQVCRELAETFRELLGLPVDPAADLWDQGATSFTMVQVSTTVRKRYGRRVSVATLLETPTVEGIAAAVAATPADDVGPAPSPAPAPVAAPAPSPAAASAPVAAPAPATTPAPPAATTASAPPAEVEFFDPAQREAFHRAAWNVRPRGAETSGGASSVGPPSVALPSVALPGEQYRWRRSQRSFAAGPVPLAALARLLGLLRPAEVDGREAYLYPSAGRTYAVQVYLHVPGDGVEGLAPGAYYYRAEDHALERVGDGTGLGRSLHFVYNREIFDAAAFQLFLVGQTRGILPLYPDDGELFLAVEAGHVAGLLMSGQAATGIGLCPIGSVARERLRPELALDDGHRFLHAFLGGPVDLPARTADGQLPPFAVPTVPTAPTAPTASTAPSGPAVPSARRPGGSPHPAAGAEPEPGRGTAAVVGLAGRFPGTPGLEGFWNDLLGGRQSLTPPPASRAALLGAGSGGEVTGGFLDRLGGIDGMLFGITPAEAETLDPQARLLFEAVWRCVEDAGYRPDTLGTGRRVGVYVASMWPDHHQTGADAWRAGASASTSGIASDLPNRLSHALGLTGPSVAVNTSCSSSLTALHLATGALARGECDLAVVAGVNLVSHPYHLALLRDLELLGHGSGAAFDAGESGWHPGEGVGALLLQPLDAAARSDGPVHGVVEGTWAGHSGRTPRFPAPDAAALARSLRDALAAAGIRPGDVDYVECAAAGAPLADAAELQAIEEVFRPRAEPLPVGTVKPNIGHAESASGMAQLVKVLLQLRHGLVAPTVLAARRTPLVDWDPAVLRVPDRIEPWARRPGHPRRALVNGLGATGSYAHVLLRDAEPDGPGDAGAGRR